MEWLELIQGPTAGLVAVVGLLVVAWKCLSPLAHRFLDGYMKQMETMVAQHSEDRHMFQSVMTEHGVLLRSIDGRIKTLEDKLDVADRPRNCE